MTNTFAFELIASQYDDCRLTAFRNSAGRMEIGYGATGWNIIEGLTWTQAQADNELASRIDKLEAGIEQKLREARGPVLTREQMGALISFAREAGLEVLATSRLFAAVLAQNWIAASDAFSNRDHPAGTHLKAALIRRHEEAALFLKGS